MGLLLLVSGLAQAQTTGSVSISTSNKEVCFWTPGTKAFDKCGTNDDYASMFLINSDQTTITHTTNDIKSTYYVNSKDFLTDCNCYSYDVTSDVGNKYTFFMDYDKGLVRVLSSGHSDESDDFLILYTIKSHWTN